MIPKVIHYCWFGGAPLPKSAEKCIVSWKKYAPGYEIRSWTEKNFDYTGCDYAKAAYEAKKWAFVSDYARFKIVHDQGGVYFDTDVELICPIDDLLEKGPFMGVEKWRNGHIFVNPGLGFAAEVGNPILAELLGIYDTAFFEAEKCAGQKIPVIGDYTTEVLQKHGLKDTDDVQQAEGMRIYPKEYFNPMNLQTGKLEITENTRSIHWFDATWASRGSRIRGRIFKSLNRIAGEKTAEGIKKIWHLIKR